MTAALPAGAGRWLLFFVALSLTVMLGHELTHHLVAGAVCGRWGEMNVMTFAVADGCDSRPWWIATMAGPLLTYVLIWAGALWRSPVGIALVFANIPLGRIINIVTGSGDEMLVGRTLFGERLAWPAIVAAGLLLLGWPLWHAARRLPVRRRWLAFAGLLVVPLLWDLLFKRILLGRLLPDQPAFDGMPVSILVTFFIAALLALATLPRRA